MTDFIKQCGADIRYHDITYGEKAPGWVDGVYYPRNAGREPGSGFLEERDGVLKIHSRVWREIEETGFGVYYYEETTQMSGKLPDSNYLIKAVLTNPGEEPYTCHIRVNGIVKEEAVTVEPGEEKEAAVTLCLTDDHFTLAFATAALQEIHEQAIEGDVYLSSLEIVEQPPLEQRRIPRIFLISDSTVQSYEKRFYPQTGWGQMLHLFFKGDEQYKEYPAEHSDYSLARTYELPGVVIENRAIGGRSARSFYDEGKLDQVLEILCPGDYMFVQFAHNDATAIRPNRYIAVEEFPFFIRRYIDACRRRGAQCVLVTPVTMRVLEEDGSNKLCFAAYREQMLQIGQEQGVPVLDLGKRSNDYVNRIGSEESKNLYMWLEEGEYPEGAYAAGVSDKAHLQEYGAKVYADMVAQMIQEYDRDGQLDELKNLVQPVPLEEIKKPEKRIDSAGKVRAYAEDAVTGFVAQEIDLKNGRGSFLLNWNLVENAVSYHIYGKKKEELTFEVARNVTKEEKESLAVFPFTAEAGILWQYYVTAVFANGSEGRASRMIEVDLRGKAV
ncbi:MAG: rhamnogalacturonan acetylesterase [Blautia sp.]|nr:rhamnogalacturonan acetylesterase [Blautia sp.]